eukprot:scaffold24087_cov49-Cyclotella_meneghiniana.AAC.1
MVGEGGDWNSSPTTVTTPWLLSRWWYNIVALVMAALLMVLGIRQLSYLAAFDDADVIVMADFAGRSLAREEEGLALASKYYTSYLL